MPKYLFSTATKFEKEKKGDGGDWTIQSRGGGVGMCLKREAGQDFPCICKYFCKLVKYLYAHVHICMFEG